MKKIFSFILLTASSLSPILVLAFTNSVAFCMISLTLVSMLLIFYNLMVGINSWKYYMFLTLILISSFIAMNCITPGSKAELFFLRHSTETTIIVVITSVLLMILSNIVFSTEKKEISSFLFGESAIYNNTYTRVLTAMHKLIKGFLSSKNLAMYFLNIARFMNSLIKSVFSLKANTNGKETANEDKKWYIRLLLAIKYLISLAGIYAVTYTIYASAKSVMLKTNFQNAQTQIVILVSMTVLFELIYFIFRETYNKDKKPNKISRTLQIIGISSQLILIVPRVFLWLESFKLINNYLNIPKTTFDVLLYIFISINIANIMITTCCSFFPKKNHEGKPNNANKYKKGFNPKKILWAIFIGITLFNSLGVFALELIQTISLSINQTQAFIAFISCIAALYSISVITNWLQNFTWIKTIIREYSSQNLTNPEKRVNLPESGQSEVPKSQRGTSSSDLTEARTPKSYQAK